jgi:hypothetical protein
LPLFVVFYGVVPIVVSTTASIFSPMPAGPVWLTLPLGVLLALTFVAAVRLPGSGDPLTAAAQTLAGFVLLIAALVSWHSAGGVVMTDACYYAAAQMWILAFWTMRGERGDDEEDGGGGELPPDPEPPWWPDFEARFRDYARDGGGGSGGRSQPRSPVGA